MELVGRSRECVVCLPSSRSSAAAALGPASPARSAGEEQEPLVAVVDAKTTSTGAFCFASSS
jgi:hypothetical protein